MFKIGVKEKSSFSYKFVFLEKE